MTEEKQIQTPTTNTASNTPAETPGDVIAAQNPNAKAAPSTPGEEPQPTPDPRADLGDQDLLVNMIVKVRSRDGTVMEVHQAVRLPMVLDPALRTYWSGRQLEEILNATVTTPTRIKLADYFEKRKQARGVKSENAESEKRPAGIPSPLDGPPPRPSAW